MIDQNQEKILPGGTVTFLFTDIQGSTELLNRLKDQYPTLLSDQRELLREVFSHWNGKVVDSQADEFFVSFPRATDAVSATVEAQKALSEHEWPEGIQVLVRMGLHTGEPWLVEAGYVGMDVHRAARIGDSGHGGQVLLSETTTALVRDELPEGVTLKDLGRHRLKDMLRPESICQLVIEGLPSAFPPLKSLESFPAGIPTPPEETRTPREVGECPYRGLAAFREEDAQFFYGREAFAQSLLEAVKGQPMVAVIVGSSGSGKSSVVYAGLLPHLKEEGGWLVLDLRPGNRPFYALANAMISLLETDLSETDRLIEVRKLADALEQEELSLVQVTDRILENHPDAINLLLLIDQFEELYTLCPDPEERKRFLDALLAIVSSDGEGSALPFVFLLTLRADFMGQALTHRPFADALQDSSLIMGPMTRTELRSAIEKPAEMQGAAIEMGLVDRILDDVGQEPGNLPLLEFALTLLWERLDQGWLTHETYDEIGRVEGALAQYAEEVCEGLEEDQKDLARTALTQLIQPGEGTEDTRRVATRAELGEENWALIQHLASKRLVVTGRNEAGNDVAEVVHEALIRSWDRLRSWMEADRAFRTWQEELRADLRQWQDSDRDEGALLRGVLLATAQEWELERGDELAESEKEFIDESIRFRELQTFERRRRRRRIMLGLVGGMIVSLALAITAVLFGQQATQEAQRADRSLSTAQAANTLAAVEVNSRATAEAIAIEEREIAEEERQIAERLRNTSKSRELTAFAMNNLNSNTELSVLLAIEAVETADIPEAIDALHQSLTNFRLLKTFDQAISLGLRDIVYSPDGRYLVTGDIEGKIKVWDPETGEEIRSIDAHETGISDISFSPDGAYLFTASDDRTAKIWSVVSPQGSELNEGDINLVMNERLRLEHDFQVASIEYDPHNLILATTDGIARVWDVNTGQELWELTIEGEETLSIAISPDGRLLATGSDKGFVRIWEIQTGAILKTFITQHGLVHTLDFNPSGDILASGGEDGVIKFWSIPEALGNEFADTRQDESSQALHTLVGHTSQVFKIQFCPNGNQLVTASSDQSTKIWDTSTGVELFTIPGALLSFDIYPICVDLPESTVEICGHTLASSHWFGLIKIWDISDTGSYEVMTVPGMFGYFNDDGTQLITFTGFDSDEPAGQVWGIPRIDNENVTPNPAIPLRSYKLPVYEGFINGAISQDGSMWGLIYNDNVVRIFDAQTGELLRTILLEDYDGRINWISFHPSNFYIATCSEWMTGIWDLRSGEEIKRIENSMAEIEYCEFISNGSRLETSGYYSPLNSWNTENLSDPESIQLVFGETRADRSIFDYMISVSEDTLTSVSRWYWTSADQRFFAQKASDGEVNISDRATFEKLLTVSGKLINNLHFSPDSSLVLVSDREKNLVRVFTLSTDQLLRLARSRVTRSLTPDELERYLHIEEDQPHNLESSDYFPGPSK